MMMNCLLFIIDTIKTVPDLIFKDIDISPLLNAKKILDEGVKSASTDLEKAGTIQSFEVCYELSWKILKRILTKKGLATTSPRDVFRIAADNNLIENPDLWFQAIEMRNLTSHTYNKELAEKVLSYLSEFQRILNKLIEKIKICK